MKTALKSHRYKQRSLASKKVKRNISGANISSAELRSALVDALRTERAMVREVITEVLEEEGLYRAMKEAEPAKAVSMDAVMAALRRE